MSSKYFLACIFHFWLLFFACAALSEDLDKPPQQPHELFLGTLWIQTSAEYYASAVQAYHTATLRLEEALADPEWTADPDQKKHYHLPPAVILDLDETALNNSPFEARMIERNVSFNPELWKEWVDQAGARPVPGSLEFVRYARSRGVEVFYVTNRRAASEEATRKNLAKLGFPLHSSKDVILTRGEKPGWLSDKLLRRQFIAKQYRILLLIGDDLNDFISGVKVTPPERVALAAHYRDYWGKQWILLPNPVYGSWERSLYNFDYKLTPIERIERKHEHLKTE